MSRDLKTARNQAELVRYSYDNLKPIKRESYSRIERFKDVISYHELKITHAVTPELSRIITDVCKTLLISEDSVDAFVYRSSEVQALCFADDDKRCVLRFSSGLINLLNNDEFCFVVGHELGHFLLSHHQTGINLNEANLEGIMQHRNQEISADRFGLIACNSINISVKAIMKILSGLTEKHLRFDVGSFISQLRDAALEGLNLSSHPSMIIRGRALLWYSLKEVNFTKIDTEHKEELLKLDERIYQDFCKYVDKPIIELITNTKQELLFWMQVGKIVEKKVFSKTDQQKISDQFGSQKMASLKNFLNGKSQGDIEKQCLSKIEDARKNLETLIPQSFENEVVSLVETLES